MMPAIDLALHDERAAKAALPRHWIRSQSVSVCKVMTSRICDHGLSLSAVLPRLLVTLVATSWAQIMGKRQESQIPRIERPRRSIQRTQLCGYCSNTFFTSPTLR
jgi:hypothetical protein